MAWVEVHSYYADWDCKTTEGKVGIKDKEGEWHWKFVVEEEEFLNLTNLLKNQGSIYIDQRIGHLGQILRRKGSLV